MAADWFCEIDGKQHGPLTAAQLKELVVQRRLQSSDPVWKEGMQKKVQAHTVKGLFGAPALAGPKRAAPGPKQEEELDEFEMVAPEEAEEVEEVEFELVSPASDRKKDKPEKGPKSKQPAVAVPPKVAAPSAGKPFRVMSGGRVRGPFSLQEIRNFLAAGKIGDADLIGVETWLPAATLAGLVGTGPGADKRGGTATTVKAVEEEEEADFEIVEEVEEEAEDKAPASRNDDDVIPVDDKFQLG